MIERGMTDLKNLAVTALEDDGWTLTKSPEHHGLTMTYIATKNGNRKLVTIRTTKNGDNGVSFVPYDNGQHWKTLSDNDHRKSPDEIVVISANDLGQVQIFNASEVLELYLAEHASRSKDGKKPQDGRGLWIPLRDFPEPLQILALTEQKFSPASNSEDLTDVVRRAREMVAEASGVEIESIRLSIEWFNCP